MKKTSCILAAILTILAVSSSVFAAENEMDAYSHTHNYVVYHTRINRISVISSTQHDYFITEYFACDCGQYGDRNKLIPEDHSKRMKSANCDKSRHTYYYDCSVCGYNMGTTSDACPNPNGNCPMALTLD